jgi:hypothetical protein
MNSVINFGKNPVSGGRPPRDIRSIEIIIKNNGFNDDIDLIFLVVFIFNLLKIINRGEISIQ